MKRPSLFWTTALVAVLQLSSVARAADAPAGQVDFGKLLPPADGGQFVEVNVKGGLLALAARLTAKHEPEVADLLRGLTSVRVNVIGLDEGNRAALSERIQSLRRDLEEKGWERVVTVQEKGQDVGVYLKHRGEEAIEGVVVTVIDGGKEAVLVNVVGDIRPEKLALIGERLNLEPLRKAGEVVKKS